MDNDVTLADSSSQLPQKRVLPSRSRRGGPGVGNCDVDAMILNAQLNKLENEPLIPADTPFVLKTNDTLEKVAAEFSSAGGSGLNLRAHESYFDRPDVLKAYREQTIIETPEYTNVSDTPSVGGRLRVRTTEENNADLDAVYEKRHKKFEKFEKGQRLREKEKLKHAQYKLKERIEQLRGMDNSAFLAAPANKFSPRPGVPEVIEEDPILGGLNGNPAYLEGERRRKEMLMNAQMLEERYRILLPPDRQKKPAGQAGMNATADGDSEKEFSRPHEDGESEFDEDYTAHVNNKKESQKLKLKLPARPSIGTPPTTTPKATPTTSKKRRRTPPPIVPPPPKTPSVRRSKLQDFTTVGPEIQSMGEPGPSSLGEPLQPSFDNLRFMPQYVPSADAPAKQQRSKRPVNKRARTEEHGVPPPADYGHYSVPPPQQGDYPVPPPSHQGAYVAPLPQHGDYSVPRAEAVIVIDDEPMPMSPKRSSSPIDEPPHSYSFPPPPPPPPPRDDYPSPETTLPPADVVSQRPVSPLDSDPGPNDLSNDFSAPLHPPTPPAEETPSISVPPVEPVAVERKPSIPPIESISAQVTTIVSRRGRSRGGAVAKPVVPRKAPQRRGPPVHLVIFAERANKNPRQLTSRRLEAFGVKLPAIINSSDSYDFELPPEIHTTDYDNREHDADVAQEVEGSEATEDDDGPEPEEEDQDEEDQDEEHFEGADDPEDETDQDSDGGT